MHVQTNASLYTAAAGPACWSGGFAPDLCCDVVKYGPQGNVNCWGNFSVYNFERCCIQAVAATRSLRHLLYEFAKALGQRDMDKALTFLQDARALNLQSHDVEFDIGLFNAKKGFPPREIHPGDSCSLTRPYYRLLQHVKPWPEAQRSVPALLCIVYSAARAHRVITQWEAWGHRCDHFIVCTDRPWPSVLPVTPFKVHVMNSVEQKQYDGIWQRIRSLWLEVTRPGRSNNATLSLTGVAQWQWVYLCGDDVFVVVENLRKELLRLQSMYALTKPIYAGHPMRHANVANGKFNSGGAGYALNRAAGKALRNALLFEPVCGDSVHTAAEDVMVAKCLAQRGVFAHETAPGGGLLRFHPFMLDLFIEGEGHTNGPIGWKELIVPSEGFKCCAEDSVSFHDMSPAHLMEVWGAVYACRPGGGQVRALIDLWARLWPSAIAEL